MQEHILSVFIDESGDFGPYNAKAPYYMVAMVMHNQDVNISHNLAVLDEHVKGLNYPAHAIHTGPLIRRESIYLNDSREQRKSLFHALFHFARLLDFRYCCICIRKSECPDAVSMAAKLAKAIADELRSKADYWHQFDRVIVYYDNGQIELTKILVSVFSALFTNIEFRKVRPADYALFQVADLICTMELTELKGQANMLSHSEQEFFGCFRDFHKNYMKYLKKKYL